MRHLSAYRGRLTVLVTVQLLGLMAVASVAWFGPSGQTAAEGSLLGAYGNPNLTFTWKMPPRWDGEPTGQFVAEMTTKDQVAPASWPVLFDVSDPSAVGLPCDPSATYAFVVAGDDAITQSFSRPDLGNACEWQGLFPKVDNQTSYAVTLTKTVNGSSESSPPQSITPKDWLIVSIGDSVASGEGAPDIPGTSNCGQIGTQLARWQDGYGESPCGNYPVSQCHRSARAASALAAAGVEQYDAQNVEQHASVTFLHIACSGSGIGNGLLGAYAGLYNPLRNFSLPIQTAQVTVQLPGLSGGRPIDALLIDSGANDIGFSSILKWCGSETRPKLHGATIDCQNMPDMSWVPQMPGGANILGYKGSFVEGGEYQPLACQPKCTTAQCQDSTGGLNCLTLGELVSQRIDSVLPALYSSFAQNVSNLTDAGQITWSPTGAIYLVPYFDPLYDGNGALCQSGPLGLGNFTPTEILWAEADVVSALNKQVSRAVSAGWPTKAKALVVNGVAEGYVGHGMCASGTDTWVNSPLASNAVQGDFFGTLHPNYRGQCFTGTKELAVLIGQLYPGGPAQEAC